MRLTIFAAMFAFLLWGNSAFAGAGIDTDVDGIPDTQDNCSIDKNSGQDDTDGDFCGNVCDTDYNQSGLVTVADFGEFSQKFGSTDPEFCHVQGTSGSILPCVVGVDDFGAFAGSFNQPPGPSGTTPGTTACP